MNVHIPRFVHLALVLPVLLLCAGRLGASEQSSPGDEEISREVDALFAHWDRSDSPGAAVLVMRRGEVLHARGYGSANLEHGIANGRATVFDIASLAKQFAAAAVLMLAEENALDLEDDVRGYLPELPDFGQTIRIRHLVHHTSGMRDWPGALRMAGWDFTDVLSQRQILTMARHQRQLNFVPGSEHAYSNTGYNLLAEIVARVSGRSFAEWTRENLFDPLGMTNTHFHEDHTRIVLNRAESYAPAGDGEFRRLASNLTAIGSSSLFTSVEDLAKWIRNLDEPRVGGPTLVARMHETGALDDGTMLSYGYGLEVEEYRGARTVSHTGSWAGYRSMFLRFPDHEFTVVILANSADMSPWMLAYRIADLHLPELPAPLVRQAPPGNPGRRVDSSTPPLPLELRQYEGEYRSAELLTSYQLRIEGGALVAEHFRLGPVTFHPAGTDLFIAEGFGRIDFLRDADGSIMGFAASSTRTRDLRFDRIP